MSEVKCEQFTCSLHTCWCSCGRSGCYYYKGSHNEVNAMSEYTQKELPNGRDQKIL